MDDGELPEDADAGQNEKTMDSTGEGVNGTDTVGQSDKNAFNSHQGGWSRRDSNQRNSKVVSAINALLS